MAWPILWTADTFFKVYREPDILNPSKRVKISRSVIYSTMLVTPLLLASNTLFCNWLDKNSASLNKVFPAKTVSLRFKNSYTIKCVFQNTPPFVIVPATTDKEL